MAIPAETIKKVLSYIPKKKSEAKALWVPTKKVSLKKLNEVIDFYNKSSSAPRPYNQVVIKARDEIESSFLMLDSANIIRMLKNGYHEALASMFTSNNNAISLKVNWAISEYLQKAGQLDLAEIKTVVSFILANNNNVDSQLQLRNILSKLSGSNQNDNFTPANPLAARRQQQFARYIIPLLFKKINLRQIQEETLTQFYIAATALELEKTVNELIKQSRNKTFIKLLKSDDKTRLIIKTKILALSQQIDKLNSKQIKQIASFIISNFKQPVKNKNGEYSKYSADAIFRAIMSKLSGQENNTLFKDNIEHQQKFAKVVAPLLFEKTNSHQIHPRTFIQICSAANFTNANFSNNGILKAIKTLIELDEIRQQWSKNIEQETEARGQRKEIEIRNISKEKKTETVKAVLSTDNRAKLELNEIRRQKKIEQKIGLPYTTIASKVLAIAKQKKINLTALQPFIETEKNNLNLIQENNANINLSNPRIRKPFYPTRTFDIHPEVEALTEARSSENKSEPLNALLKKLDEIFKDFITKAKSLETKKLKAKNTNEAREAQKNLDALRYKIQKVASPANNELVKLEQKIIKLEKEIAQLKKEKKIIPEKLTKELEKLSKKLPEPIKNNFSRSKKAISQDKSEQKVIKEKIEKAFKKSKKRIIYDEELDFKIIKTTNNHFYYISNYASNNIGKGGYGSVALAYNYDIETGTYDEVHPMIVKQIPAKKIPSEIAHQKKKIAMELKATRLAHQRADYQFVEKLDKNEEYDGFDSHLLFSDYFPGTAMNPESFHKKELSLEERLKAAIDLFSELSMLHNKGYLHGDLNPNNILLYNADNNGRKQVGFSLIDNGGSRKIDLDPNKKKEVLSIELFPYLTPPENLDSNTREHRKNLVSLKRDIFQITPTLALLLGAKNPLKNKEDEYQKIRKKSKNIILAKLLAKFATIKFNLDGLLESFDLPEHLVKLVKQFIEDMQSLDPRNRPDANQCLKFFTTLYNHVLHNTLVADKPYDYTDPDIKAQWQKLQKISKGERVDYVSLKQQGIFAKQNSSEEDEELPNSNKTIANN